MASSSSASAQKRAITHVINVKNEEPVIQRNLDATVGYATEIYITDTGSTDNTVAKINEWAAAHPNIKVTILYQEWVDYGTTKTWTLAEVRKLTSARYIAFNDADEVFITNRQDPQSYLTPADGEKLLQEMDDHPEVNVFYLQTLYGNREYPRWQFVRNNQEYVWEMPWQEYLVGRESNVTRNIQWIVNFSRPEGFNSRHPVDNSKNVEKMIHYVETTNEKHNIPRGLFYIAQAYNGTNNDLALKYYYQRVDILDGSIQERYISFLQIARITSDKERYDALVDAIRVDPIRLEAYYELASDARAAEKHRECIGWCMMAPNSRKVPLHAMFSEFEIYNYQFDFLITISSWYCGDGHVATGPESTGKSIPVPANFVDPAVFRFGYDAGLRCLASNPPEAIRRQCQINTNNLFTKLQTVDGMKAPIVSTNMVRNMENNVQSVIIIDNFYSNPDEIRKMALAMAFPVEGNYPGKRTVPCILPGTKERFEAILGRSITYWPVDAYNGSFQYTLEDHKSWIHRDATDLSCVVYLTPNPPVDGGTKIYRHKVTNISRTFGVQGLEDMLMADRHNEEAWDVIDRIGNVYNRAVIFRGRNSHMSDRYFGTDLESARLFQTFFFDDKAN